MPAEQIARNLAFVNWTVLTGLAVGAFGAVVLLRLGTEATKGYLGFTAFCAAAFGGLAWISDGALPVAAVAGSPIVVDPTWDLARRSLLALLVIGSFVYSIAMFRGARAPVLGVGTLVAGIGALIAGALTWGGGPIGAGPLAVQLLALAASIGGAFAGMILGHWYLVTPKLSTGPALALTRGLLWIVGLQVVLFGAWIGFGAGQNLAPFAPLDGLLGPLRLAAPPRRPGLPADRDVGRGADGQDALDGIRDGPALHRRRRDRGGHDPRRGPVLRGRPAGMSSKGGNR